MTCPWIRNKHLAGLALGLASLIPIPQAEVKILLNAFAVSAANSVAPLTIRSFVLAEGEVNVFFASPLEISGGSLPYVFNIIKGSLPPGLNLDNNGMISGTPSQAKNTSFIVRVTDQVGTSVSKKLEIKILKALEVTTRRLKSGKVGKKYSDLLKAAGGEKPFIWSLVIGSLPKGLGYGSSTGEITGVPKAPGSFNLTFQVTDPLGGTSRKDFVLVID